MKESNSMASQYVRDLVARARTAFSSFEYASQEYVDFICARVAWAGCREEFAGPIAELAYEKTGLGDVHSKYLKMRNKLKAIYAETKDARTVDVVNKDPINGIIEYAKPVGVIGALVPVTNPEMTPFIKALWSLKTRNAIILAPHPRALEVNEMAVNEIRRVLELYGYPPDLVIGVQQTSIENSKELMTECDLVLATGGAGMVQAAYSSGKPAYGVGTGNAVVIVDETVDVKDSAKKIRQSKTFDQASGCSADNSCLVHTSIYDSLVSELMANGAYIVRSDSEEKNRLRATMWADKNVLNRNIVAQPATRIAALAGIEVPPETEFLVVEEDGIGDEHPFSREKLSPVLTLYRWDDFDAAVDMVNEITANCGSGHSCAIHTHDDSRAKEMGRKVRVARVTVNQAHALANSGSWSNGLVNTATLGCGTWGGNIVSENVYYKHLLNTTRVAYPLERSAPSDEEVFGENVINEFT
jgi:sulfoacetaldehyde dehydrogenase